MHIDKVGFERRPAGRLLPVATEQHPGNGRFEVVVTDLVDRGATEFGERLHMTLQERLLRLGDEGTVHRLPRIGQPHREQERLGLHPPQDHPQIGEIDLGLTAGFMGLRHIAFCHTPTGLSGDLRAPFRDIVPDRRVRNTLCCLLIHQPGQHPPGGMPLLPRRVQIRFQPLIDDRFVFLQPAGHPHRRLPGRRQRRRQRLPHRPAVHMMPIRQLPDR